MSLIVGFAENFSESLCRLDSKKRKQTRMIVFIAIPFSPGNWLIFDFAV